MISSTTTQNVERLGIVSEKQFQIKASAKAFKILSDGLYSDKITSIIRELSSNAYDSHVQAKNDNPFKVHLPNTLEPHFSVRDFGVGLSHEDVINIFTTYFESTKTNSNDYIGCLGLGSKSPFSYTDNFSVTSWFNGTKNTYNCFINEQEIPSCALFSSTNTTEPNGVEVLFAVKANDFSEFYTKAVEVYKWFKTKPEIVGAKVTIPEIKYRFNNTDWGMISEGCYGYAKANMGNVSYPIHDAQIENLTEAERSLLRMNIVFYFNIGDLEVSASREKLSFNALTKKNIHERLTKVITELTKDVQVKIDTCVTLWDARTFVWELNNKSEWSAIMKIIGQSNLTWKGTVINDYRTGLLATRIEFKQDLLDKVTLIHVEMDSWKDRIKFTNYTQFHIIPDPIFIIKDVCKHVKYRLIDFKKDELARRSLAGKHEAPQVYMLEEKVAGGIEEFKKILGMDVSTEFVKLSTLNYTVRPMSGVANPKNSHAVLRLALEAGSGRGRGSYSSYWTPEKVDKATGGVYVLIDRYLVDGNDSANRYFHSYIQLFNELGITMPTVYGVKTREVEEFRTLSNWQTFRVWAVDTIKEYILKQNLTKSLESCVCIGVVEGMVRHSYENRYVIENIIDHGKTLFSEDVILSFVTAYEEAKKVHEVQKRISRMSEVTGYDFNQMICLDNEQIKKDFTTHIQTMLGFVKRNYPLFLHFSPSHLDADTVKNLRQYIELLDKEAGRKIIPLAVPAVVDAADVVDGEDIMNDDSDNEIEDSEITENSDDSDLTDSN